MLNKRSAAQKANSNTVVSGRVLNQAKKPRSVTHTHTHHIHTNTHTHTHTHTHTQTHRHRHRHRHRHTDIPE